MKTSTKQCVNFAILNCNNGDVWISCQKPDATGINPSKAEMLVNEDDLETRQYEMCSVCEHYKEE